RAEKLSEEVPSLTLNIELLAEERVLDVKLICSTAFHVEHKYTSFPNIDSSQKLSTGMYVLHHPVNDLRCKLSAFSSNFADVASKELKMPLNLMCRTVTVRRSGQCKVTIESSLDILDIKNLFPERYRIQAESMDFIYLFTDELITRIQGKQPDVKLNCTLPLDQILHDFKVYVE
ncbi:unnamed protein product, partial [Onchocerca ochengi]|uniref:PHTB1_C domain-containing protein n=1 Tax=Onchocerca ochengi TaxID=42157 RepID=A0A182ESX3_ONCOC